MTATDPLPPADAGPADTGPTDADVRRPLAPDLPPRLRRRLLVVLSVVFALWVAALLAMYFATVYPQRHPRDGRPGITIPPAH